jgi:hypothetical protein
MKKFIFSLCLLGAAVVSNAQWTFQFKFTTSNGLNVTTTPFTTNGFGEGYHSLGTIDMTPYLCEGGQFNLENMSSGYYSCGSGASTINSSTIWDAAFGRIYIPNGGTPAYNTIGSMLLNDQTWPAGPTGLPVRVPVNASTPLISDPNNNPNYVYYVLAVAPGMGCNYFGLNNGNASCTTMLFFYIKVRRAPKPLADLTVCPGTTITDALLGIPSGVTASNWAPTDPRVTSPATTSNYGVSLSNANSCSITDAVKITVTNPVAELFPAPSTTICPSQLPLSGCNIYSSYASKITVNNVVVYDIYASPSEINPSYINSNDQFQITAAGSYTIQYEYSTDQYFNTFCTKTYTVYVPRAPKLLVQNIALCNNQFTDICAPNGPAGIFYTYKWYYNNVAQQQNVLVSNSQCFTPTNFGTYTLVMTNQFGCTYSNTYNITLSPSANPNASFTYTGSVGAQVGYAATPNALNSYNKWELILCTAAGVGTQTLQTVITSGMGTAVFNPVSLNQYYTIRHTVSSTPCNVITTAAFFEYAAPLSGKNLRTITTGTSEQNPSELNVFPNPSNGIFTIAPANFKAGLLEVYDMTGKKVYSSVMNPESGNQTLDLSGYSKGIYLLNFISNEQTISKRIVLE